jgi:hypothetical protein
MLLIKKGLAPREQAMITAARLLKDEGQLNKTQDKETCV